MSQPKIENLEELLQKCVGDGRTVTETNITPLTGPGENFGSIMLKVDAKLNTPNGKEEMLHWVAKCIPENEFFKELFQVDRSVIAEIKFYTDIVPLLQEFQREHGGTEALRCFAKLYGGRLNLREEGEVVDDHALLLMENLKVAGFRNIDRFTGFDLEGAKLVLKDVADFHASCLALRLQKPQLFEDRIKKYCRVQEIEDPGLSIGTVLTDMLEDYESCKPYIEKIKKLIQTSLFDKEHHMPPKPGEMFATVAHKDLWVNNTMQRIENGKIVENKIVDFQGYKYDSPVRDLMFFLFTSCQFDTLKRHTDELIGHYFKHFTLVLGSLGCSTTEYTTDLFYDEIKTFAQEDLPNIMFFTTFVVFGKKTTEDGTPDFHLKKEQVPEEVRNRVAFAIEYYGKHGWL